MNFRDLEIMARTVYGEARGEEQRGKVGVANVIINRAKHKKRWPNTIRGVCRQPLQFSCWNKNDPNLPKLLDTSMDDPHMIECLRACLDALEQDVTRQADHYHADYINPPSWTETMARTCQIGTHIFYKARG